MSEESALRFEIGHVLFIDIVGYSKLLINQQSDQLELLRKVVRATEQFKMAEAEGKLQRLPTGDGGALVFRNDPEAPVSCAMEISEGLKQHPEVRVRMGIHSGPVNQVADLNDQANIAGAGVNIAQRVMDCGDAGHILLSKRVADDLAPYPKWNRYLHDLGECEVKHGERLALVNFFTDEIGNPSPPRKCQTQTRGADAGTPTQTTGRQTRGAVFIGATALVIVGIGIGVFMLGRHPAGNAALPKSGLTAKSIAVLPFENLSADPSNAYFADGIQEEILTRLSRIADLKVISRTSTQKYKSAPENLREVGQRLGVANVLEGSVQRAGDQVRVNVQLINTETDSHAWAEKYDRRMTDIFAVESEIAAKIADTLQAKLTGTEQQAIATRPTESDEAHELYLKGRYFAAKRNHQDLTRSIEYFLQATQKDPNYALAYAGLADSYGLLPQYSVANPKEFFPKARAAADKALVLDDSLPEAHTSLGFLLSDNELNFKKGREEFEKAIALNPNSANAHYFLGLSVFDRVGQSDAAIREIKSALELDPLSVIINANLGYSYIHARRYPEAIAQLRKTIELEPNFPYAHGLLGMALLGSGDAAAGIAEWEKAYQISPSTPPLAFLTYAYSVKGDRHKVEEFAQRFAEQEKKEGAPFYYMRAVVAIARGDKTAAIENLEKSYEAKETGVISAIKVENLLDSLRDDPRFEKLVNKVVPPEHL